MRIGIITGASSGLGKRFCENIYDFFPEIDQIWLVARRSGYMDECSNAVEKSIKYISMDITNKEEINKFEDLLRKEHPDVKVTVLDALTYCGNLDNFPPDVWENKNFSFCHGNILDKELVFNLKFC